MVAIEFVKARYKWVLLATLACVLLAKSVGSKSAAEQKEVLSADTIIPAGFVLVPIEVFNRDSLDSLLGDFGVVDLYQTNENGKGKKIASRIKIMRAPLKRDEFAVLIPEGEAQNLVQTQNPYYVIIQNIKQTGTKLVKPVQRRSRITFGDG